MAEPTVKCGRCGVTVPTSKLNPPPPYVRCLDHRCPLHSAEVNAKLAADWARSIGRPMAGTSPPRIDPEWLK